MNRPTIVRRLLANGIGLIRQSSEWGERAYLAFNGYLSCLSFRPSFKVSNPLLSSSSEWVDERATLR